MPELMSAGLKQQPHADREACDVVFAPSRTPRSASGHGGQFAPVSRTRGTVSVRRCSGNLSMAQVPWDGARSSKPAVNSRSFLDCWHHGRPGPEGPTRGDSGATVAGSYERIKSLQVRSQSVRAVEGRRALRARHGRL